MTGRTTDAPRTPSGPAIYPVIHHLDAATTQAQAGLAARCGAHGVFLINHDPHVHDEVLVELGLHIRRELPGLRVGVNMLHAPVLHAARAVLEAGLDMVWGDDCGVSSAGLTPRGEALRQFAAANPGVEVFASVAFKYRPHEPLPGLAADTARLAGFTPVTSGSATGRAPDLLKIEQMSRSGELPLAVASGMTPENVVDYARLLSAILVATGVSVDEHHFDAARLRQLVQAASACDTVTQ